MSHVILVVDDDATVRSVARMVLERDGYTVLEAEDGAHALVLCEAFGSAPDLILTDIMMPDVDGGQLIDELSREGKTPRVLMMSGYADESVLQSIGKLDTPFLQKPFTIEELSRSVRQVLGI